MLHLPILIINCYILYGYCYEHDLKTHLNNNWTEVNQSKHRVDPVERNETTGINIPYHAQLMKNGDIRFICGAAIVSRKRLITAASCVWDTTAVYDILVGSTKFRTGEIHQVAEVTVHPDFNPDNFDNDIAILKVEQPLQFDSTVNAIKLPGAFWKIQKESDRATLSGFREDFSGTYSGHVLKSISLKTLNLAKCATILIERIHPSKFCTTCENIHCNSCLNNPGEPLERNGVLIGIVPSNLDCRKSYFTTVFTNIEYFQSFIYNELGLFRRRREAVNKRVIGGKFIDISKVPYQAALILDSSDHPFCGGTIVSKKHILTAAHCVQNEGKYSVLVGSSVFGKGQKFVAAKTKMHPKYLPEEDGFDIGIITLKTPLKYGKTIKKLALPSEKDTYKAGDKGLVTGFGRIEDGELSHKLRAVHIPLIDTKQCKKLIEVVPHAICATCKEGGCDSCQGDSGGPFMLKNKLIGIVSYGIGCGLKGHPGVYTEVKHYLDWINKETNKLKD